MTNKEKNTNAPVHGRSAATLVMSDVMKITGLSYGAVYTAVLSGEIDGFQENGPKSARRFTQHAVKEFMANRERAKAMSAAIKNGRH